MSVGQNGVDGTATRYGVNFSGIESRWGEDIPHTSRPALGDQPDLLYNGYGVIPGDEAAGARR